jgi:hypothetical protein
MVVTLIVLSLRQLMALLGAYSGARLVRGSLITQQTSKFERGAIV